MQIITLTGDKEENYYQLGLKDKHTSKDVYEILARLLKSTNKITDYIKNYSSKLLFQKNFSNYHLIQAYAEGIGLPEREIISYLVTPDIISAMSAVIPKVPSFQFGCSSLFYKNANNNMSHLRILDFPIGQTYTKNERLIQYSLKGEQKYCALSTSGFPFPSITAMNQSGLTFALHQKFGHIFNKDGTPIFDILENLITHAESLSDIISELKYIKSISTWGIYISSQEESKVLAVDLLGAENIHEIYEIDKGKTIYFNNKFINKNIDMEHIQPLNFSKYCDQREKDANDRIKKLKTFDDESVLKNFTSLKKTSDNASVVTPSTILSCVLNPKEELVFFNNGNTSRIYAKQIEKIHKIWTRPTILDKKKPQEISAKHKFYEHLINAQICWDKKDEHNAVHHAQMAKSMASPNQLLPTFFLEVFISLSAKEMSLLKNSLGELNKIVDLLDDDFADYCKLFIFRLEKICFNEARNQSFRSAYVKKIYEFENNLPMLIFRKVIKELTVPRIDLQDIIFLHPLNN